MKMKFSRLLLALLAVPTFASAGITPIPEVLAGIAPKNKLVFFSSTDTSNVTVVKVTGLAKKEKILAIDRRPFNGLLYALGSTSRLYTINTSTGVATAVSTTPFVPALSGTRFAFDFNPFVDRIRIISNTGQNLRVHPDTGVTVLADLPLAFAGADVNFGATPAVAAAAYTNNVTPAPLTTTLYDIDVTRDILVTQSPPNDGTLNTVGALGINATDVAGFDIAGSNGTAYASFQLKLKYGKSKRASLYTINLGTGAATLVGKIGGPYPISGLTALGQQVN